MIWEAWCILNSLKKHFFNLIATIQVSPSSFTFMSGLGRDHMEKSLTYIHRLLQSLSLRFPCPSTSHDMRGMRSCLSIEFEEDSIQHNPFEIHCSITELFNYVSLDSTTEEMNSRDGPDVEFVDELKRLHEEIPCHREAIEKRRRERNSSISSSLGFQVE